MTMVVAQVYNPSAGQIEKKKMDPGSWVAVGLAYLACSRSKRDSSQEKEESI